MANPFHHFKRVRARHAEVMARLKTLEQAVLGNTATSRYDIYYRMQLALLLDQTSLVDEAIRAQGTWEPVQLDIIRELISHLAEGGDVTFLDIGAYWGLYSLVAANAGASEVIAFEGDRHNFSQLHAQLFLNGLSRKVTANNVAVTDRSGTVEFIDSRAHPTGNRAGTGLGSGANSYTVRAVTIDEYLSDGRSLIVGKIDVEGHECEVLSGMRRTISQSKVLLQVESFPERWKRCRSLASELGLRVIGSLEVDHYLTNMLDSEVPPGLFRASGAS